MNQWIKLYLYSTNSHKSHLVTLSTLSRSKPYSLIDWLIYLQSLNICPMSTHFIPERKKPLDVSTPSHWCKSLKKPITAIKVMVVARLGLMQPRGIRKYSSNLVLGHCQNILRDKSPQNKQSGQYWSSFKNTGSWGCQKYWYSETFLISLLWNNTISIFNVIWFSIPAMCAGCEGCDFTPFSVPLSAPIRAHQ